MVSQNRTGAAKQALTQAIEDEVHRLDMNALLRLAADLNVKIPNNLEVGRAPASKPVRKRQKTSDTVLVGDGMGPVISATEGRRILDAISVDDDSADWAESELVGAGEVVKRLNISRGTLDNWRKAKRIVSFRKGLRNYLYPLRQFKQLGPVDGLDRVIARFSSPEETWEWLVSPNRMTGGKPPVDILHKGDVEQVVEAAEGALDFA